MVKHNQSQSVEKKLGGSSWSETAPLSHYGQRLRNVDDDIRCVFTLQVIWGTVGQSAKELDTIWECGGRRRRNVKGSCNL